MKLAPYKVSEKYQAFYISNVQYFLFFPGVGDHGCEYMTGGNIVILGETGRNFAAGMSGGIAYVYDVNNRFSILCNQEMVDLESVEESDVQLLNDMITKHYQYTKSSVANFVLNDFENQLKNFVKVFPKDYKKALAQSSFAKVEKIEK